MRATIEAQVFKMQVKVPAKLVRWKLVNKP
jgi:hypothetical protein